jgi:NadR type nicotinamide-nucleotide adenylyltransferase
MDVRRVALLGAASSGKTTLARALADSFGTLWVPEYLREFCDRLGRTPVSSEQADIARIQVEREDAAAADLARRPGGPHFLFCDTTPLMTAVYSDVYFGGADAQLEALARTRAYDLTFVAWPDIPWEADPLHRDGRIAREDLHALVLAKLDAYGMPWLPAAGDLAARVAQVTSRIAPTA